MNYVLLIQTIINAVKSIEELMPESKGKEKLDAAVALVEGVFGSLAGNYAAISKVIATVVSALNAIGIFKKKPSI